MASSGSSEFFGILHSPRVALCRRSRFSSTFSLEGVFRFSREPCSPYDPVLSGAHVEIEIHPYVGGATFPSIVPSDKHRPRVDLATLPRCPQALRVKHFRRKSRATSWRMIPDQFCRDRPSSLPHQKLILFKSPEFFEGCDGDTGCAKV